MFQRSCTIAIALLLSGAIPCIAQDRLSSDPTFPSTALSHSEILHRLARATPMRFRPVGSSSIVFKTALENGTDASFRPRTLDHMRGHLAEVAAYRISRTLGMDNVPPAVLRRLSRGEIRGRLNPDYALEWESMDADIAWDPDGRVLGVSVFWVDGITDVGVDREGPNAPWRTWLRQGGTIPEDKASIAADVSTMIAFDYLIANRDRFSGGNARADASRTRMIVRDHNLAFGTLSRDGHGKLLARLASVEKFSRGWIEHLRALDEAKLRTELAQDPLAGENALNSRQILDLLDRRRAILSRVAALIDQYGQAQVLAFP